MKIFNFKSTIFLVLITFTSISLFAQLDLPRSSPKASVSYQVGYTNIDINYAAPGVKDRDIWGTLVPYDKVWRAGANEATTIEFSTDIKLEGKELAKGKYAFFVIPKKEGAWTVIFNTITDQWGAYEYDESKDALRLEIKPKFSKVSEERLNFTIIDQTANKGYFRLGWEKLRLYVRYQVDFMDEAMKKMEEGIANTPDDNKWQAYAASADFLVGAEYELPKALKYAEESTKLFSHSWNWWVKAKAQAANGDFKGAIASAAKSAEASATNEKDDYYEDIRGVVEAKLEEWKAKP